MDKYEELKKLLADYDKTRQDIINKIIQALKSKAITYKQVEEKLTRFKREIYFKSEAREKYDHLFNDIKKALEEEKNDLPLTNRSGT